MIATFFLLITSLVSAPKGDITLTEIRASYSRAANDEAECTRLLERLNSSSQKAEPLTQGYLGCATMMMANHVANPGSKLDYFRTGRNLLEAAIAASPAHIELRYLRYTIQTNAPSFLGYNSHITADSAYLKQVVSAVRDEQLREMIRTYLKANNHE